MLDWLDPRLRAAHLSPCIRATTIPIRRKALALKPQDQRLQDSQRTQWQRWEDSCSENSDFSLKPSFGGALAAGGWSLAEKWDRAGKTGGLGLRESVGSFSSKAEKGGC
jgi:hypothetical protein